MREDLAALNVTRTYTLAASNIAIFTFMLFFLYPRFKSGRINPVLFQATLIAMGVATFSLVFATLHYYRCSLGGGMSRSLLASRLYHDVPRAKSGPLLDWASYRRICLARLLARVLVLRGPILPQDSDAAGVPIE